MNRTSFKSVDEYIAAQSLPIQDVLQRVRRTIRSAVPAAEEGISYKIPAYRLKDRPVLYFAAWKHHFSLYPATATIVSEFGKEVAPYFDNKSTLRFPLSEPVPVKLIERIAKFRAMEVYDKAKVLPPKRHIHRSHKEVPQRIRRDAAAAAT